MKRILVTGGAGFLGSNLCHSLVKDPRNHVTCLDNLSTGKLSNIEDMQAHLNFDFIQRDVQEPIDLQVDQIYNAACPASPPAYQKRPTDTIKTCVIGTMNMLDLATRYGATMLQFSTSEVYGDPTHSPQDELYRGNVNPIGIRSCYDEGKRCAEALCFDYHREFGTKIKVVRIFNTYGPYMDPMDGRVVSNFIIQALKGEKLTIYGTGEQTRSFCYVDDLIEGIYRMMNDSPGDFVGPVNLGNPNEFTVQELAQKVLAKVSNGSSLSYLPLPSDDPMQRCPDIDLARRKLQGWEPAIPLDSGLDLCIEYFRSQI